MKAWRRKLAGTLWLAAWCAVLYTFAAPWRRLGGLESERLRYLEWWVLFGGVAAGYAAGRLARDWVQGAAGRSHARALRVALYPPAALAAAGLAGLAAAGERGPVGVAATAFLAYWAGLDVAFGAVPLMEGKPYSFLGELPADEPEGFSAWDRF